MKTSKISICTVCMNRLHHIKETLPKNIEDNKDYDNVEFVLLDYNSTDGLEEWVKEEMQEVIASGLLRYGKTTDFDCFDRTHSRNMLFKLATGDILCNVDADNYTSFGYARYVAEQFEQQDNMFLVADTHKKYYFLRNAFGRFCCKREDYFAVGGMDESMKSYGSETLDLYERLIRYGRVEVIIQDTRYLQAIPHEDEERISNEYFLKNIDGFYISHIDVDKSLLLFLYRGGTYDYCGIKPEEVETHLPAALDGQLDSGTWTMDDTAICLSSGVVLKKSADTILTCNGNDFRRVEDANFLLRVAKNYSFIVNNNTLKTNNKEETIVVNSNGLGQGKVIINFNRMEVLK